MYSENQGKMENHKSRAPGGELRVDIDRRGEVNCRLGVSCCNLHNKRRGARSEGDQLIGIGCKGEGIM